LEVTEIQKAWPQNIVLGLKSLSCLKVPEGRRAFAVANRWRFCFVFSGFEMESNIVSRSKSAPKQNRFGNYPNHQSQK